ncbi:hypothetical protein LINPERPRIM_LOCUS13623 [Linum perenne]
MSPSSSAAAEGTSNSKPITVKLLCPALSKIVPYAAWEEQRLDLTSIAMAFGLEPRTLKLNGYLIGRGSDLMSSMTWRSLLNYFSGKGLPVGKSDGEALIVDGKLSKVGSKRGQLEDAPFENSRETHKKLKLREINCSGRMKRKLAIMEDINLLKRLKLDETISPARGVGGKETSAVVCSSHLKCRSMKRVREEDGLLLLAAPCKRIL